MRLLLFFLLLGFHQSNFAQNKNSYNEVIARTKNKTSYNNFKDALLHKDSITYITFTNSRNLPLELSKFKALNEIDIDLSPLINIDSTFNILGKIKRLEELYLFENNWTYIPETIGCLKRLNTLYIDGHKDLTQLPKSIKKLRRLEEIAINNCPKLNLENAIELLTELPKLEHLDIGDSDDLKIPKNICQLIALKSLWISHSELKEIPESIKHFPKLNQLYLGSNRISQIEFSQGDLPELVSLFLNYNALKEFPLSLQHLKNLKRVNLNNNRHMKIPKNMAIFKHLDVLSLIKCDISKADQEYLKKVLPNTTLNF